MENDATRYAMDEERARFDRIANRHDNGTAPVAVTAYQLFQTPPELARRMAELAEIDASTSVLEPSAGLGRLLDAIASREPRNVTACEIAPQLCRHLYKREEVRLLNRDFLTVDPAELPLFDRVVMNPPFHMRADIKHIRHALTFLRPGGILVALALDTEHRAEALKPIAEQWERIDEGTFAKEGTRVACVLMKIRAES
jgi:predicted RNA methylase